MSNPVGATCELRRIEAAQAHYFLRHPRTLAQQEAAEAARHYADLQRLGYAAYQAGRRPNPDACHYDWVVLAAQTAGSPAAWRLLVQESHVIGGPPEQELLEGEARLLLPVQVQALHAALQSVAPPAELYPDQPADLLAQLQQLQLEFQHFVRETAAVHQALLLLTGP